MELKIICIPDVYSVVGYKQKTKQIHFYKLTRLKVSNVLQLTSNILLETVYILDIETFNCHSMLGEHLNECSKI